METVSFVSLVEQLEQVAQGAPEQGAPEQGAPEPTAPPGLAKPKRVRAKVAQKVPVPEPVPEPMEPVPELVPTEPVVIKARAKRAPRPPKVKKPVEVVEYEDELPPPAEPTISNEDILQHLLNHRVRQRVQREQFYQSFVAQF
jgi:hypothetical protein